MRPATLQDLDFVVQTDLEADQEDAGAGEREPETPAHRDRMAQIVQEHLAWVIGRDALLLALLYRRGEGASAYSPLADILPQDALYAEVFQLWVRPEFRRQGFARALKQQLELAARERGAVLVYTHTRARNAHVLALNRALGYEELYRGPMWDEVGRVALVKWLQGGTGAS